MSPTDRLGDNIQRGGRKGPRDGGSDADRSDGRPDGVLPPVREGGAQANCDGKGLDSLEVCFGEESG
jgi:hypothetical protein